MPSAVKRVSLKVCGSWSEMPTYGPLRAARAPAATPAVFAGDSARPTARAGGGLLTSNELSRPLSEPPHPAIRRAIANPAANRAPISFQRNAAADLSGQNEPLEERVELVRAVLAHARVDLRRLDDRGAGGAERAEALGLGELCNRAAG